MKLCQHEAWDNRKAGLIADIDILKEQRSKAPIKIGQFWNILIDDKLKVIKFYNLIWPLEHITILIEIPFNIVGAMIAPELVEYIEETEKRIRSLRK
jgi:hypothetical protein